MKQKEGYVVFDHECVWGVGRTHEEALKDAKLYLAISLAELEKRIEKRLIQIGTCSQDLITSIETHGGQGVVLVMHDDGTVTQVH